MKRRWKDDLLLTMPDLDGEFVLETDASNVGLGAVLKQDNKSIAYASHSLTASEKIIV